jgi:uncharacterized damage-inducible protein DinB
MAVMMISEALLAEFNQEAQGTRRLLERLPEDRLSFKPHPKSMSLSGLATHVAHIPEWAATIVNDTVFDVATIEGPTPERKSRREILEYFEKNVKDFGDLLRGKSDQHLFQEWTLKDKGTEVFTLPRVACLRTFILNHIVHHRGQLTVYMRMNDVPLPGLYGPSADEGM